MSRRDAERLADIADAISAIRSHLARGALPDHLLATEPTQPWSAITRMRDHLDHHYFDTERALVTGTVTNDLDPLQAAVKRLQRLASSSD